MKNIVPVVLTGSLGIDQIMSFNGLYRDIIDPEKLDVLSIIPLVTSMHTYFGGIAGNIAFSLGLLGDHPILYGVLNSSEAGYIEKLKKAGVNVQHVCYSPLPTAMMSVLTDKNNCQVGGFYPGAMGDAKTLTMSKFNNNVLVVISAHDPDQMNKQIHECVSQKKRFIFDPAHQIFVFSKEALVYGIKHCELFIVNEYEFGMVMKKCEMTKNQILDLVPFCIITRGEHGADVYQKSQEYTQQHIAAVSTKLVKDPSGAGDAFRAGFLYGYARGWLVQTCVELGCVVASFVVEAYGAQEHTFTWREVEKRYKKTYNRVLKR
jgi:adenosine kinase